MTTLRSTLLTLALLLLLLFISLVQNAPDGSVALAAPVPQQTAAGYFVGTSAGAAAQPSGDSVLVRLLPSAAANRQFANRGAWLRSRMGANTISPVPSAVILPNHAAARTIALAAAQAQAPAVAAARRLPVAAVLRLVDQHSERFTFSGETQVNLSMLNRALDELE